MDPLEISGLCMEPGDSAISALGAFLVSPSESALVLTRVPARVHADRPLELELAAVGFGADPGTAVSIASWISAHVCLTVKMEGQSLCVPVTARHSGGGWVLRALARPSAWASAESVTVVSLSLAGRPLPCDYLPATLPVGYNHAPSPPGAVLAAVKAGDLAALRVSLDAGGSTEEADEVGVQVPSPSAPRTILFILLLHSLSAAVWPVCLLLCSLRRSP